MSKGKKPEIKDQKSKGEYQPNTGIIKRFGPADATLRPWRIKKGSSHPWIVESETNVKGYFCELGAFSYKPFAELVAAAPELLQLVELFDAYVADFSTSSIQKFSLEDYSRRFNEIQNLLNRFRSKATPDILRLPARKEAA